MTYRVVQWGTGWAGRQAIPGILDHPDLELVGVFVRGKDKDGVDAGVLAGMDPIGILATSDFDEVMSLGADCHSYMMLAHISGTLEPAIAQLVSILEAGQNVSQTSVLPLYYPKFAPPEVREPIEAACAKGNSRCYTTGVYPGVMNDLIPMALLAASERVDKVRVTEILNYIEYYGAEEARQSGVGGPMPSAAEVAKRRETDTVVASFMSGGMRHLAERLGFELDEIRTGESDLAPAVERAEVEGYVIEPGTIGARRHSIEGCVAGRPVIEFGFVTRYDNAAAPDWPKPRAGYTGCYRIEVEGSLSFDCDVNLVGHRSTTEQTKGFATSSAQLGAYLATTAPAINAIPFLCQADPGLYGSMDLHRDHDLHVVRGVGGRNA